MVPLNFLIWIFRVRSYFCVCRWCQSPIPEGENYMIRRYVTILMVAVGLFVFSFTFANASRGVGVYLVAPTGEVVKRDQWMFAIGIDTYIEWPRLKTAVDIQQALS